MDAMKLTAERITNMTICVLYDKFDFRERRIAKALLLTQSIKDRYKSGELTAQHLISYANAKGIDLCDYVKKIPTSQKAKLGKGGKFTRDGVKLIEAVLIMELGLSIAVLKESPFKFTKAQMNDFLYWISFYIDEFYTDHVTDKILKDQIFEDEKVKALFVA